MFRQILTLSAAFVAVVLALGLTAGMVSAQAGVPGLSIGQIGYNAVGNDREWNRNSEYIDVSNVTNAPVNVKNLVVSDSWAKNHTGDANPGHCNTFTVTDLPGVDETDTETMLPAWHTIRVYTGAGTPKVFGPSGRIHAVYKDSKSCGFHGHYLNNGGDTVWISLGGDSESKSYNFRFGYYVR